jgi:hypothetical protein
MKKILLFLMVAFFTLTFLVPDASAQSRRHRRHTKTRHWATNAALVGGGAVVGGLLGGKRGAVIGTGAGVLAAAGRKGSKQRYGRDSRGRRTAQVVGGGLVGGGIGSYAGKRGAVIGAGAGAGIAYLYTRHGKKYYRTRTGSRFYVENGRRHYM